MILITFFFVWSMAMILLSSGIPKIIHNFLTTDKVMMETLVPVSIIALIRVPLTLTIALTAELTILTW